MLRAALTLLAAALLQSHQVLQAAGLHSVEPVWEVLTLTAAKHHAERMHQFLCLLQRRAGPESFKEPVLFLFNLIWERKQQQDADLTVMTGVLF